MKNVPWGLVLILTILIAMCSAGMLLLAYEKEKKNKAVYVEIDDDFYYIDSNIRLLERVRNPLDVETGQYYLVLHYHDSTRRRIYFKDKDRRDRCYARLKVILRKE